MSTDTTETTATPPASASVATTDAAPKRRSYWSLWAKVPREFAFLILTMPIAITGLVVLATTFFTGLGLIALVFGVFIVVASLFIARGFGTLELVRLRWAGRTEITRPVWDRDNREQGFWRTIFAPFVDGHYWLYMLHGMVINPVISIVSWSITIAWTSVALGGTTGWIWQRYIPDGRGDQDFWLYDVVVDWMFPGNTWQIDPVVGETVFEFILGLIFLATLPFVFRGLTLLHDVIARGVLGSWRSEALEREVAQLAASRGAAVQAEDASLRRLERDIHDGPQQRLVRLQMDLAAIERKLERDPESARELLVEAREQARETLDELRALSRGFAPPILQDRGLAVALQSVAARSPIPVTVEIDLPTDATLPASIERNAYFIAAELLTNAVKHAEASGIRLTVSTRDTGATGHWLDLWVTDNGRGGASPTAGHGLAGLDERVQGLRGVLVVDSPVGGPTTIGAHIPFAPLAAAETALQA
ncbi:sensor histidine kinase [Agromyces cerinus]|uniref:histidine kinase n=1 Tax=Agromyces cerinus subsp. cerinus TaxID=232089 RepID=A0A1N6DRC1_9MICO|nr:sensor domain-containing protein [Agromyces cerinus]SIN73345.1 Signal transduction histidine kinase [Agromyces cerinus subsp. cerinus]